MIRFEFYNIKAADLCLQLYLLADMYNTYLMRSIFDVDFCLVVNYLLIYNHGQNSVAKV